MIGGSRAFRKRSGIVAGDKIHERDVVGRGPSQGKGPGFGKRDRVDKAANQSPERSIRRTAVAEPSSQLGLRAVKAIVPNALWRFREGKPIGEARLALMNNKSATVLPSFNDGVEDGSIRRWRARYSGLRKSGE